MYMNKNSPSNNLSGLLAVKSFIYSLFNAYFAAKWPQKIFSGPLGC